jgi:hypothetical protein
MKGLGCIEAQVDQYWCAPIAIFHPSTVVSGIVVDVQEEFGRVLSEELDVYLLPR